MATKEAVAQLAALPERVAVVETKVDQIEEKLDDLKVGVKDMHECLDNTRDLLTEKLSEMSSAADAQHQDLYQKINELEELENAAMPLQAANRTSPICKVRLRP